MENLSINYALISTEHKLNLIKCGNSLILFQIYRLDYRYSEAECLYCCVIKLLNCDKIGREEDESEENANKQVQHSF